MAKKRAKMISGQDKETFENSDSLTPSKTEQSTKANGLAQCEMAKAFRPGRTARGMRVSGRTIMLTERANSGT